MKKNLVLIMMDQLRKDYLGCYGNQHVSTPNIDQIAERSSVFENCYVNNPICMPNRLSIFTGRHPRNHGMWTNGLKLPHELPTMADHLKERGYRTASIGKLHFTPTDCGGDTPIQGMEDHRYWEKVGDDIDWHGPYWGFEQVEFTVGHTTRPIAHYGKWFRENGGRDEMAKAKPSAEFPHCPTTSMPEELHDSMFVGKRCAEYIRAHGGGENPFFLVASFPDPHHPFNPPHETALKYKDAPITLPVNGEDDLKTRPAHYRQHQEGIWHRAGVLKETEGMSDAEREQVKRNLAMIHGFMDEEILRGLGLLDLGGSSGETPADAAVSDQERDERIRATYAMVDLIDKGVGEIIAALEESGELENTVIVITADHGELMGDHGLWLKGPFFYDGLIQVPLIIHSPDLPAAHREELASSIDIYPTCCQLLGIDIPRACEGVAQCNPVDQPAPRDFCLVEYRNGYFENDVHTMVYIDQDYKYVAYQTGEKELFDRKNDPEENSNLAFAGSEDLVNRYNEKLLFAILNTGSKSPDQVSHA